MIYPKRQEQLVNYKNVLFTRVKSAELESLSLVKKTRQGVRKMSKKRARLIHLIQHRL